MIRFPILSRVSGSMLESFEVARTIQTEKPDAVLLYAMPTVGIQSLVMARHYGIPVVFRAIDVSHELVPNGLLRFPTTLIEDFVFNAADLNVALTPHLKRYIQTYGVSDQRIRLLPSGVDTVLFSPGPRDVAALERWSVGAEDLIVLFMGTLYRFCGLERTISEFPRVLASYPTAKLMIAGSGEAEARLRSLTREKNLQRHVIFTGVLPYADLPNLIRSADICINPFELNGITRNILPTKLFQYMTCGKPVLATALPGTTPFLKGEEHGVLYSELDRFTDTLIDLLSDPDRRALLGGRAIAAAQPYDWYEIAKTLVQWLQETARCPSFRN
jgi:glycosyltransferase involved in cell wall biosynthesis